MICPSSVEGDEGNRRTFSILGRLLLGAEQVFQNGVGPLPEVFSASCPKALLDSPVAHGQAGTALGPVSVGGENRSGVCLKQVPASLLRFRSVVSQQRIDRDLQPGARLDKGTEPVR